MSLFLSSSSVFARVCPATVEVAIGPLLGPLAGLGVARSSGDVVTPEVALARGGTTEKAGESLSATSASPSALVIAVAGVKDVMSA